MSASFVPGRFVSRLNRFRVQVRVHGRIEGAYLPNPGRLRELLVPDTSLRLVRARGADRRTRFDVLAGLHGGEWVCLDTRLANTAVADALAAGSLPGLSAYREIRAEAPTGDSRLDFRLARPGTCWIEVKCCSLVVRGRALFPDAPTQRGARHLRALSARARRGDRAVLLVVVVRRATRFSPNDAADPAFGRALRAAQLSGVEVRAHLAALRGPELVLGRRIPVDVA